MNSAISVSNLSKQYCLGMRSDGQYQTLRESLVAAFQRPFRRRIERQSGVQSPDSFWALRNVSFDVEPGEVVGIIGRNGAGKSTLLKILSRIVEPTAGCAKIRGRVGSLLEVGTGFHPELTGRENIYLNGSVLGMKRKEIDRSFHDIVAFAEVEKFLDTPVKRYSSGMYVRLAFAVASHLNPEILVVDEVLAVGDQEFQRKCLGKMSEISESSRTILFVSHNMAAIQRLCKKVVVLDQGQVSFVGLCAKGIEHYMRSRDTGNEGAIDLVNHPRRTPGSIPTLRKLRIIDSQGIVTNQLPCGDAMTIEFETDWPNSPTMANIWVVVTDGSGCRMFTAGTFLSKSGPVNLPAARRVTCQLEQLRLTPGRYALDVFVKPLYMESPVDHIDAAAWFDVLPVDFYGNGRLPEATLGPCLARSEWHVAPS